MKKEEESTPKISIQYLTRSRRLLLEVMMERQQANEKNKPRIKENCAIIQSNFK